MNFFNIQYFNYYEKGHITSKCPYKIIALELKTNEEVDPLNKNYRNEKI